MRSNQACPHRRTDVVPWPAGKVSRQPVARKVMGCRVGAVAPSSSVTVLRAPARLGVRGWAGWRPGGGLAGGLGVGDGGYGGHVHGRQRCPDDDEGAGAAGHGRPPDRSVGAVWTVGWLVGGHIQPPGGQPPPATAGSPSAPTRRAGVTYQPRMVGLLVAFGDALVGQRLAQPGMLVVHESHPFPQLSRMIVAGSGWAGRAPSESGTCHTFGDGLFPIFGRWLRRPPFPSGRTRGIIPARWAAACRARPLSAASRS